MINLDSCDGLELGSVNVYATCKNNPVSIANNGTTPVKIGDEFKLYQNKSWEQQVSQPKSFGFPISPFPLCHKKLEFTQFDKPPIESVTIIYNDNLYSEPHTKIKYGNLSPLYKVMEDKMIAEIPNCKTVLPGGKVIDLGPMNVELINRHFINPPPVYLGIYATPTASNYAVPTTFVPGKFIPMQLNPEGGEFEVQIPLLEGGNVCDMKNDFQIILYEPQQKPADSYVIASQTGTILHNEATGSLGQ